MHGMYAIYRLRFSTSRRLKFGQLNIENILYKKYAACKKINKMVLSCVY